MKNTCSTFAGILVRSASMVSSSPWPSPVRLSPLCFTPNSSWLPKKTAPTVCPSFEKKTTDTSRSMLTPAARLTSQPRPAVMRFTDDVAGRSMTEPFSMAKATFCRFGAPGMTPRMRFPRVGSRMSMKCRPSRAGSSMMSRFQLPVSSRTIMDTASTSSWLDSRPKLPTEFCKDSSSTVNFPFLTSRRWPLSYAAITKMMSFTLAGNFFMWTHTTSSSPSFCPVSSSPEWVTALTAFRLL
mmetsp:Transcript_78487/g.177255  ORF Transcript_78487/g.177255 Transcript_78487/m.177255 type:complete len:240 (-) Transcript_78487:73-792(-)